MFQSFQLPREDFEFLRVFIATSLTYMGCGEFKPRFAQLPADPFDVFTLPLHHPTLILARQTCPR